MFGIYKCISISAVPGSPDFLDLQLEAVNANGSILEDEFYGVAVYPGFVNPHIDPDDGDKTFVYTQPLPAVLWTIEHNMDKFPSVSVVNINNVAIYGDITYLNQNELQIEFSAGFSGKAYLN